MNIFFAASIKGGRALQPEFEIITNLLERLGTVHAPHTADATLSSFGETALPDSEIAERELSALAEADIVVVEVTTPSLGVGYLIARATGMNKKVIALYRGENTLKLSSMIKGDARVFVHTYENDAELEKLIPTIVQASPR